MTLKNKGPRKRKSAARFAPVELHPIGVIRSTLKKRSQAPRQGSEGAPNAWLEISPFAAPGLEGIRVGDHLVVLTWLHRAARDVLKVHPRSDPRRPLSGVFTTRSPDRPNPLGLHPVIVRKIVTNRLLIGPIEAIDGTPVIDVKPLIAAPNRRVAKSEVGNALLTIFNELLDGPAPDAAWILNPKDSGLIRSLAALSSDKASAISSRGGASIAAHVDHLRYGLELLNRWSRGEKPFADADYSASWSRSAVSDVEWASRREALRNEAYAWREALKNWSDPVCTGLTEFVASVVHLAYHLGAIRQIDRSTRGPSAG